MLLNQKIFRIGQTIGIALSFYHAKLTKKMVMAKNLVGFIDFLFLCGRVVLFRKKTATGFV